MFPFSSADNPLLLNDVTSFGAAGLMGAMWLWERRNSQKREQQLDEAHERVVSGGVALDQLINVVKQNAEALARLTATQEQLLRQLAGARVVMPAPCDPNRAANAPVHRASSPAVIRKV